MAVLMVFLLPNNPLGGEKKKEKRDSTYIYNIIYWGREQLTWTDRDILAG